MCFSGEEPGELGPRRVSKKELYDAFAKGWGIESIEPCRFELRLDLHLACRVEIQPGEKMEWPGRGYSSFAAAITEACR
jgi:hypothetical protein